MPNDRPTRGTALARWIIVPLVLVFLGIVLVFYVLFHATRVVGPSMRPTLYGGDGLLLTTRYPEPKRGDIVVARVVGQNGLPEEIVKRVIAVPGDVVEVRDDVAIVNGVVEQTPRIIRSPGRGDDRPPRRIQAGFVYLMGDNRIVSYDSRYLGPVALSSVEGRAVWIFMPITRVRSLPQQERASAH